MAELGEPLSERELDVLKCIVEGASNREVALQLSISPNTVKVHIRNIFTKLGVSSRTEATTAALQQGLVTLPGIETTAEAAPPPLEDSSPLSGDDLADDEEDLLAEPPLPVTPAEPPPAGTRPRWWVWVGAGLSLVFVVIIGLVLLLGSDALSALQPTPAVTPTAERFVETPLAESWSLSRPMPQVRANMASAAVGLDVYQIGGETAEGVSNSVDIYAVHEYRWRVGAPKLTAVADAAAAVLAGEIYVIGGRLNNGQVTGVVEAYSPLNNGWRPVTPLPRPVAGGVVLSDDAFIYLFGGFDGQEYLADSYRYDPTTQSWQSLPPLAQPRAYAGGGVAGGKLYVVGGADANGALASCAVFDPAGAVWAECAAMQQPRRGAGVAALLNKLYVFGGLAAGAGGQSEVYDPVQQSWTTIETPMLADWPAWSDMGTANVETRIYVLGGRQEAQLLGETYVFTPFVYQFFIPSTSAGGEPEE